MQEKIATIKEVAEAIKSAGLSEGMTAEEVVEFGKLAEERDCPRGTPIVVEDSKSRDLFVIKKGRVSVRLTLPSEISRDEIVYAMRDGQMFGELSLVDGSPRSATVRAEDDVRVYQFDYQKLVALLESNPRIGYLLMRNIAAVIATRIRSTNMLWRNSLIW